MFKTSRRALGVATALTLSAVILAPAASASLLGSGSGGSSGGSDLTGGLLGGSGGGLLGGDLLGGLTGGLLGGDLLGGLPVLGGLSGVDGADGAGGALLSPLTDTTLGCDAAVPQILRTLALGDLTDTICTPFDGGLGGVTGLLGSL
ncbi:MAG TPA: hypothetical protein VGO87_15190 [Acidimicrobiia bacterium]